MQTDKKFCEDTWLWIDQICIDQSRIEDRNHQVNQMSKIYSEVEGVIIWLGLGFDHSDVVMAELSRWRSSYMRRSERFAQNLALFNGIVAFSTLQYWQRLWVCQEVVLARHLLVRFGPHAIEWNDLIDFSSELQDTTWDLSCLQRVQVLHSVRLDYHHTGRGSEWGALFRLSISALCEDERDKVYGMLGIVQRDLVIKADYSLDVEGICRLVLAAAINSSQGQPSRREIESYRILAKQCRRVFHSSDVSQQRLHDHIRHQVLEKWSRIDSDEDMETMQHALEILDQPRLDYE